MKIKFAGNMKVNAETSRFTIETDQHEKAGGGGSAPEPFEYFLASIGTCAGLYVHKFCQVRSLPTEGIEIDQKIEYDTVNKRIGKVKLEINVPEDFPEKYHDALVKAANSCAVKKYLENPFEVETTTKVVETSSS